MAKAKEMSIEQKGNDLVITCPLNVQGTPSRSGKTIVLASTRGNRQVELGDGSTVVVSVNVYRYAQPR